MLIKSPTPEQIKQGRAAAKLTQAQAAEKVNSTLRAWQHWERGDRVMHPAFWELFLIKSGQIEGHKVNHH